MKIILTRPFYIGRSILYNRQELSPEHLAKYGYFNPILTKKGEPAVIPAGTEVVNIDGSEFNSVEECYHAVVEDNKGMFDFKGIDPEIRDILEQEVLIDFCQFAIEEYDPKKYEPASTKLRVGRITRIKK